MLSESLHHEEGALVEQKPLSLRDTSAGERFLFGSTENMEDLHALRIVDFREDPIDQVNIRRAQTELIFDHAKQSYRIPSQVMSTAITTEDASMELIRKRLTVHTQLPPLDTQGRVSGEWELALVTRRGEPQVVTDAAVYNQLLSPEVINKTIQTHFSVLPPREGRPFPRLALKLPARRG